MAEPNDWRVAAAAEIGERRSALERDKASAAKALERAQAKLTAVSVQLEELDRSVRVLGVPIFESFAPADAGAQDADPLAEEVGGALVRDMLLRYLKSAYPAPLRVAHMKPRVEAELGRPVHYKTPGMTLYRMSGDGLVRREGRDWFYVPQARKGLTFSALNLGDMTFDPGEQGLNNQEEF